MIATNLDLVISKINKGVINFDIAAAEATEDLKVTAINLIKDEIKGTRPKGQKATTGQPPMNRTGNLRASIRGETTPVGFANYTAVVGPTVGTYARAVEVGSPFNPPTWKNGEHFPYVQPAFIKLSAMVSTILKRHF